MPINPVELDGSAQFRDGGMQTMYNFDLMFVKGIIVRRFDRQNVPKVLCRIRKYEDGLM